MVLLSLAELLVEEVGTKRACQQVVKLAKDVENESKIHAVILLWKDKALRLLGLHTASRDTLTTAFRRKKGRDDELLQAIQRAGAGLRTARSQEAGAAGAGEDLCRSAGLRGRG